MTLEDIAKLLRPLRLAIVNLASRAVVNTVDDAKSAQAMQVEILKGEVRDVERLQNFGFTSSPKAGAEAVVLRVGGKSDHTIVIVCEDRRYRLQLNEGEVAMYDATGSKLVMKSNGDIEATPSSGTFKIAADLHVTGDVNCDKTVTGSTDCVGGGKSLKGHKHKMDTAISPLIITTTNAVVGAPCTATSANPSGPGSVSGSTAAPT